MNRFIRLLLVLVIILALFGCGRRNGTPQSVELQQTIAAATLQALVAQGGQQPAGQQPPVEGQQPPEGEQPPEEGQQPPEGDGQPPVLAPVGDQADLVISKVEVSNHTPDTNQAIQVKVTIENRGPKAARNFQWGVFPTYTSAGPNNPVGGETIGVLNAGVAKIFQVEVVYPSSGTFTLRAIADLNNVINDPDRSNNLRDTQVGVASVSVNQKPKADLKITNVTVSNLTPNVNEEVTISATVFNAGPDKVTNLTWGIYPMYQANSANQPVSKGVIAQLNPNDDTFISTKTAYPQAGNFTVKVVADMLNAVDDPFAGGGETVVKVKSGVVAPPAPSGCRAWAISATVVNISFNAPAGEPSEYEGFRIYEHSLGLVTTILGVGIANAMGLQPGTHYSFFVVSFKGGQESDPAACRAAVDTPAQ